MDNIFLMPLGNGSDDNVSWPGLGLFVFKLFLALLILRGASVDTVITAALIGGLAAVVFSILAKVATGDKALKHLWSLLKASLLGLARSPIRARRGRRSGNRVGPNASPRCSRSASPTATRPSPRRPEASASMPVVTYAGYGQLRRRSQAPRRTPAPPAPTGDHEAQEALAYLEHIEREKHGLWSGAS